MSGQWLHMMDAQGLTPLDRAFDSGHMAVAEMMLRQELMDQSESLKGSTPLHRAAALGLTEAVRSLLNFGGQPMSRDFQGETALHKAVRQGHKAVATLLVDRCDVNAKSSDGMTALHWACLNGNQELVEPLLARQADPCLRNDYLDGLTPVDMAVSMKYRDLVETLGARPSLV